MFPFFLERSFTLFTEAYFGFPLVPLSSVKISDNSVFVENDS